jgi:hypothetical protein
MSAVHLPPLVTKEIRALLPAWAATLCAVGVAAVSGPRSHGLGAVAYVIGSVTLGSQSVGHEYTHRTLTLLLSQPVERRRLLLTKLGVTSTLLLTLAAFASLTVLKPDERPLVLGSILCGLFLAPLLTMVCRNALAGPVFAGAMPMWAPPLSDLVGAGVVWAVALPLFAVSAVASWRVFMRLEAIDARGSDLRLPQLPRRTAIADASSGVARSRHPVWLLVKKELHLQQMTFAVAGLWAVIWAAVLALAPFVPGLPEFPLAGVGILYGALLAVLIGSLASAEERQSGTLEWQLLLPMATWKQWAVKVGTTLVLTALLSYAFPLALAAGRVGIMGWHAGAIVMLTTGSLYISSLCRTTVRALMVSGAVLLGLGELGLYVAGAYGGVIRFLAIPLAVVCALTLWFALENHRSAGQDAGRVSRQVMWIAGCLALGVAVVTAFP